MGSTVLEAVRAIRPILEANRKTGDGLAGMAPATLAATREAGIYAMFAPREIGGSECSYPEMTAVFEELGYADPSVPWHLGNATAVSAATHFLPKAIAREILASGGPFGLGAVPSGRAKPVEGGYLLNGRWPFMTGALVASWSYLNGLVMDGDAVRKLPSGAPDVRGFVVPTGSLVIHRTWGDASAMRGTGSHSPEAVDLFVPEALADSRSQREVVTQSPIAQLPFGALSPITNAAICVGIARGALEALTGVAASKVSRADGSANKDRPRVQVALGSAHAAVASLSAGLQAMSEEVWSAALAGGSSAGVRARMWGTMFWTMDQARQLMHEFVIHATSQLYSGPNVIEAGYRDMLAINASMEDLRDLVGDAGRQHLGLPPANPFFMA